MKLAVDFIKCNPVHNMTILVKSEYPADQHPHIASQMMAYSHLYAEQVGFIEQSSRPDCVAGLKMAGGEFCGNACISLAACLAAEQQLQPNERLEFALEASGTEQPVLCQVEKSSEEYVCEVKMPLPVRLEHSQLTFEGTDLKLGIVRYHDFFHTVIEVEHVDQLAKESAERLARLLGVASGGKLVAVLLYHPATNELAPLIYIPSLDSMVWERGCGSGTSSLGAYLAWSRKETIMIPIRQPGGIIHVNASYSNGKISSLSIKSSVCIVAQGTAYVDVHPASHSHNKESLNHMETLQHQMVQFLNRFTHAAAQYNGTTGSSLELEQAIEQFSSFVTDENNQRIWKEAEEQEHEHRHTLIDGLRSTSALCVAIMEKYRALKLLKEGDNRNDYFHNIEASIEKEFGSFRVSSNSKVVLVGSGSFPMTPLLIAKRTGASVIGIDIDKEAIELGRKVIHLLGKELPIRLENTTLEQLDGIGEATHIIFSSTVSIKYELLNWLHQAASPEVVVAMRYGNGLKSLFNYPMEHVDPQKWHLAETVARSEHIFDVAIYRKALMPVVQGGA